MSVYSQQSYTDAISNGNRYRRLSNNAAERADLFTGPNVLVPPKHLMASSQPADLAVEMEMAKQRMESDASSTASAESPLAVSPATTPLIPASTTTTDEFALAFDIDGVLIRGGKPIPAAIEAMKYINGDNPYGVKV
jgi:hypothetical protein